MPRARANSPGGRTIDLKLEQLGLADVHRDVLAELEELYARSYRNCHMYQDLIEDIERAPEVFKLFVMCDRAADGRIVGARVIESLRHPFVDYLGFPPVHGKRFSVAPERRGQGIGAQIVAASNTYVFDELALPTIFGESNEIGALALHGREGALYLTDTVVEHFPRNTGEQALAIFAEFIENPRLRELRLPSGRGVQYAYCRDEHVTRTFQKHRYVTKDELLQAAARLGCTP